MVQWNLDEVLVYKNQRSMYPSLNDVLNYGGMERADEGRLYHFGLESRQTPRFEKKKPLGKSTKSHRDRFGQIYLPEWLGSFFRFFLS